RASVALLVFLLLGANDVGGAIVGDQQVFAVVGGEELLQRLHARHQAHQIVLVAQREHGIDQIVPHALLAQVDFVAVVEEGEEIIGKNLISTFHLSRRLITERIGNHFSIFESSYN